MSANKKSESHGRMEKKQGKFLLKTGAKVIFHIICLWIHPYIHVLSISGFGMKDDRQTTDN